MSQNNPQPQTASETQKLPSQVSDEVYAKFKQLLHELANVRRVKAKTAGKTRMLRKITNQTVLSAILVEFFDLHPGLDAQCDRVVTLIPRVEAGWEGGSGNPGAARPAPAAHNELAGEDATPPALGAQPGNKKTRRQ